MAQPAAKQGDIIHAEDTHLIQPPGTASPTYVPGHIFNGLLDGDLSTNVLIERHMAATKGSTATNYPAHIPIGGTFVSQVRNHGKITSGSSTVFINGHPAARSGDSAETCAEPQPNKNAKVIAASTVLIGG